MCRCDTSWVLTSHNVENGYTLNSVALHGSNVGGLRYSSLSWSWSGLC